MTAPFAADREQVAVQLDAGADDKTVPGPETVNVTVACTGALPVSPLFKSTVGAVLPPHATTKAAQANPLIARTPPPCPKEPVNDPSTSEGPGRTRGGHDRPLACLAGPPWRRARRLRGAALPGPGAPSRLR